MDFLGVIWEGFWHTLFNILVAINSVVGSPGLAIIIFTILMRSLTIPLTMKALRSSRNMQQIQPLIKDIQKKYGKDRAKQQEETMKLYRDYGINPAAGCFPMLVQLPIFIGLYSALSFTLEPSNLAPAALEAWRATHHSGLLKVLWNPDWVGSANFAQPFLWVPTLAKADPIFIWPLLSGLFQFIQSRMSLPRRDPNNPMDSQQRMMQNIMQFMPLYIVFISLGFPTGNVIYWAFSSLFGAVQQYFITGFGSLPDFPGFGWLPRKPITPPTPLEPHAIEANANKRKGVMARMMEKAVEAQEQQKAVQGQTQAEARAGITSEAPTVASLKANGSNGSNGSSRNRAPGATNANARQVLASARNGNGAGTVITGASSSSSRFASDTLTVVSENGSSENGFKANGSNGSNGASGGTPIKASAQLPRKRKNKR